MAHVNVTAANGRYLFKAHMAQAKTMLANGVAKRMCKGKQIKSIELVESLSTFAQYDHVRRSENSRVTTFKKQAVTGRVHYLKTIHKSLEPLYRQAQLDCMVTA